MRFRWLLPGVLGAALLSFPVDASELRSWRFDANRNRLDFVTDDAVQPRAQLISNPTRLVIDLPGVKLPRPTLSQSVGGKVRSVRIGQFSPDMARIVVELAPGYTLDPEQIKVRGATANQWSVELPTPQPIPQSSGAETESSEGEEVSVAGGASSTGSAAQDGPLLEGIRVTQDGIFLRMAGRPTEVEIDRPPSRDQIQISLEGTTISSRLSQRTFAINRFGVRRLQVSQAQASPPVTRVTLSVASNAPDWRATVSTGGVALVPSEGVAATIDPASQTPAGRPATAANQVATIQSVSLEGNQLLIQADQPLSHSGTWERGTGAYRITLNSARLSNQVRGPQLLPSSPLLRVRMRQQDPRTVIILIQPAAGVQVGALSQVSNQLLSLQLQQSAIRIIPPTTGTPIPPPPNRNPITLPPVTSNPPTIPRRNNSRFLVVIDPGHGGPDPGAIGIAGLQEKGIVLDIGNQVTALLQQRGIDVVQTRQDDRDLDLEPRVRMAEQSRATVFVSIHANAISLSRPDVSGLETYHYGKGERLARLIHSSILQAVGPRDRGVRRARFYVLRRTSMPSVLIEVGFVTGREDASRLSDPAYRSQMAAAIARGILQYLGQ
ncbi:MAG: N-acetylmuramoyl-L-alanine amidase [Leptolyngbyaceae cyanobacterium bins.59]|nr:N-acetylmuramoyl-L-alanine amidase [Leptolyngbyaceae cyanobacterium bins.59]